MLANKDLRGKLHHAEILESQTKDTEKAIASATRYLQVLESTRWYKYGVLFLPNNSVLALPLKDWDINALHI